MGSDEPGGYGQGRDVPNGFWREVLDWAKALLFAFVVAMGLRYTVAEARDIPSDSMVPTLEIGDRIMVDKLFWRFDHLDRKHVGR